MASPNIFHPTWFYLKKKKKSRSQLEVLCSTFEFMNLLLAFFHAYKLNTLYYHNLRTREQSKLSVKHG